MIYQPHLQQGGSFIDAAGDGFIGTARPRVARRMIVLCAASDYV
jgi:hypothetical protein